MGEDFGQSRNSMRLRVRSRLGRTGTRKRSLKTECDTASHEQRNRSAARAMRFVDADQPPAFLLAIHSSMCFSSTLNGTEPVESTSSLKSRTSKPSPSACFERSRSSEILSWPIL
ncbi:hypothetical protein D3C71_1895350 [compost metagenome]